MNAVVEVATAQVVAEAKKVVTSVSSNDYRRVEVPAQVATSTTHVPTLGSHSISAVAPDSNFQIGGLARA